MLTLLPPENLAPFVAAGAANSNLAFALRFLPAQQGRDLLLFYAFCRLVDDVADDLDLTPTQKETSLDAWLAALQHPRLVGLPKDFADLIRQHELDVHLLQEIVRGVRMDTEAVRIANFAQLRAYCWRVASAVGLVSARLFGCRSDAAFRYAENLGLALQLTNILRDTAEDAAMDRIYHPIDELKVFGVGEEDLFEARETPQLRAYFEFQAGRAWFYFRAAARELPAAEAGCLMTAEIMRVFYSSLLREMQREGYRVFQKRYHLPKWRKVLLASGVIAGTKWFSKRSGVPGGGGNAALPNQRSENTSR